MLNLIIKPLVLALVFLCANTAISATHRTSYIMSGGPFVPPALAQKILIFNAERLRLKNDGDLLVCPYNATVDTKGGNTCLDLDNKNAWQNAHSFNIPGYSVSGIQLRHSDVVIYFSKNVQGVSK